MTSFVRKDSNFRPLIQQKAAWENPRSRLQILGQSFFNMNTLKGLFVQSAGFQLLFQMVRGPVDWGRWWLVVVGCEKSQLYAAYGKIGKISCWNGGTHCTPKSSKRLDHLFFCIETIMVTWRSPMTLRTPHVVVGFFHQTSIYSGFSPSFPTFQSSFQVERPDFLFSNVDRFRKRKASAAPKAMGPGGWNILKLYNMGVFHKW